jgi:DNA polymerase elongation subunit (family B)
MPLVIDIETVGQKVEELPDKVTESLYRSIERDDPDPEELERRREELINRLSLDATTGRIICVGVLDTESGEDRAFCHESEKELLEAFWQYFAERRPELIVTFHGKRFDVPYLNLRSAIHGIAPEFPLSAEPGERHRHFDVREVLEANDRHRRGGLDYFCAVFGIPSPKMELDGASVGDAYAEGRIQDIVDYCLEDCRATAALYERLAPFYPAQV